MPYVLTLEKSLISIKKLPELILLATDSQIVIISDLIRLPN